MVAFTPNVCSTSVGVRAIFSRGLSHFCRKKIFTEAP